MDNRKSSGRDYPLGHVPDDNLTDDELVLIRLLLRRHIRHTSPSESHVTAKEIIDKIDRMLPKRYAER